MAEQLKFALHPVPFARQDKCVRKFIRAEVGGKMVMLQKCAECADFTDQPVVCLKCQKESDLCR